MIGQLNDENVFLSGISISPGLAMGKVYLYRDILEKDIARETIEPHRVDRECSKLCSAMDQVREELNAAQEQIHREIGPSVAEIFRAHQKILEDSSLAEELRDEVSSQLLPAEEALRQVFDRWQRRLAEMESETFRARHADIADLARRILRVLLDIESHTLENMPPDSVLVAKQLYPSDAVFFSLSSPAGLVVERGCPGSHCALLTRELGIPGVAQVPNIWERASENQMMIVDGIHGTVTVSPDEKNREHFAQQKRDYDNTLHKAKTRCQEPAVTQDGRKIPVLANVGNRHDARTAAENGADGVGLYRTELLYARRDSFPTENEIVKEMKEVLRPMKDRTCIVRLMDVGGDKELRFLESSPETNPFLGRRGVRLLLDYRELLEVQLKALLRLSTDFPLQIMVPMVTVAEDMRLVRETLHDVADQMDIKDVPPVIALVETPAAALCIREVCQHADHVSIGTNDLTQYTMAAGRDNPSVVHYFQDDHPAILRLVKMVCEESGDKPVSVCGELAGRMDKIKVLIDAGVDMLSVAPPLIPSVKQTVRELE